jgi:EpsI family protein
VCWILVDQWATNYLYSYGFVVPFVSGYVVWTRRQALAAVTAQPDWRLGLAVSALGISLLVIGAAGSARAVEACSLVVTLAGLLLLFAGRPTFRLLVFPILYLLLAIPVWTGPVSRLQIPSQILSGRIAVELLHWIGIPAIQDGTLVILPNQTLDVLRECSGVNQLVAVSAMTLPAAVLFLSSYWRRALFVLLSAGVAYMTNGFRIALVGMLGYSGWNGSEGALIHLGEGLVISALGYGVIGLGLLLLVRGERRGHTGSRHVQILPAATRGPARRQRQAEACVLAGLLFAGTYRLVWSGGRDVPLRADLSTFPSTVGSWVADPVRQPHGAASDPGSHDRWLGETLNALYTADKVQRPDTAVVFPADHELLRVYRDGKGARIELYIGYYRSQQDGRELAATLTRARGVTQSLRVTTTSGDVDLREVVRRSGSRERRGVFWYVLNGRIITNPYLVKGYTLWNALTTHRTNGAVIEVAWDGEAAPERAGTTREPTREFLEGILPLLPAYIPS